MSRLEWFRAVVSVGVGKEDADKDNESTEKVTFTAFFFLIRFWIRDVLWTCFLLHS